MSFWEYNKKKFALWAVVNCVLALLFAYPALPERASNLMLLAAFLALLLIGSFFLVYVVPGIIAFRVIARLLDETEPFSIVSLFENHSVVLKNEHSPFFFTKPIIEAKIDGIPVVISYIPNTGSGYSEISFLATPLAKENSKRIYSDSLSFKMYVRKRLRRDIKPEVLDFINKLKSKGYFSGAGRIVSTKHFEQYAE